MKRSIPLSPSLLVGSPILEGQCEHCPRQWLPSTSHAIGGQILPEADYVKVPTPAWLDNGKYKYSMHAHIEEGVAQLAHDGAAVVDALIALQIDALLRPRRTWHIHRQQLEHISPLVHRMHVHITCDATALCMDAGVVLQLCCNLDFFGCSLCLGLAAWCLHILSDEWSSSAPKEIMTRKMPHAARLIVCTVHSSET